MQNLRQAFIMGAVTKAWAKGTARVTLRPDGVTPEELTQTAEKVGLKVQNLPDGDIVLIRGKTPIAI
jgi:DNA mismatch repair protein MutH